MLSSVDTVPVYILTGSLSSSYAPGVSWDATVVPAVRSLTGKLHKKECFLRPVMMNENVDEENGNI